MPYGVDVERFHPDGAARTARRRELRIDDRVPLCFAAGRLVHKKGFEYVIDALADVPGAVLAIAGDGTLHEALERRAETAGVAERIRFLGNQSQDRVGEFFAAADVICAPSVRDDSGNVDGLPNVVLEAMASATPLVTTAAGGIGAVVEDRRTGLIVPERDAGAIASAMRMIFENPARAHTIGTSARAVVQRSFGWDRVAARFEAAYSARLPSSHCPAKIHGFADAAASQQAPGLSIFFPAYNDSGTIASLVIAARQTAARLTYDFEVIVVNDGSRDATAQILDELARTYQEVRVVHHRRNRGYGAALRSGFAAATRELVFYTDGDAQYDPSEMSILWNALRSDVDLVNGYKISRSDPRIAS